MAAVAPELPALARDQAFETLYRRYVKDVYRYALALLRNPADAEDVTQTTFMNAYRAYKRGEEPTKPQNWLIKIAHNAARTRYATAARRVREVPLDEHVDQLSLPEEERPEVEAVLEALARLPLNQRAALVMRELEGRTYKEIAETIGVSVSAVETLIFRARRALRLKASAVRVLGLVPLPGSLTRFLGSGTETAAGGSAAVGSGLLLKAAIAVVVGAVATSVGGDRTHRAQAAEAHSRSAEVSLSAAGADRGLRSSRPASPTAVRAIHRARRHTAARAGGAFHRRRENVIRAQPSSSSSVASGGSGSSTAAPVPTPDPVTTVTSATTAATSATTAVTSAVDQVTSAVPTPTVSVPQLPSAPSVPLPAPPPPPKLP